MMPNLDPAAPNAFAAAVEWLNGTLLGTMATLVAVLAVASVGFLLMTGRVDVPRATRVIVGCFILFGAASISAGFKRVLGTGNDTPMAMGYTPPAPVYSPTIVKAPVPTVLYDPYAGAALPAR